MEPIYALYPGMVTSKTDGDWHFIDANVLAMLYGVPLAKCVVVRLSDYNDPSRREFVRRAEKLIPLRPRYDGNYKLPEPRSAED